MSIQEKIEQLRARRQAEEEEEREREKQREQTRSERFARELPGALEEQRKLFDELREAGIIGLLEEMTYPQRINPDPGATPNADLSKEDGINDLENQEWKAETLYPEQRGDGSVDGNILVIRVSNSTIHRQSLPRLRRGPLKVVKVTYSRYPYSPNRTLRVLGESETLRITIYGNGKANHEEVGRFEDGLTEAFFRPQIIDNSK